MNKGRNEEKIMKRFIEKKNKKHAGIKARNGRRKNVHLKNSEDCFKMDATSRRCQGDESKRRIG